MLRALCGILQDKGSSASHNPGVCHHPAHTLPVNRLATLSRVRENTRLERGESEIQVWLLSLST